jgi:peptidyl-prolyl cis-trans isomerase SurA
MKKQLLFTCFCCLAASAVFSQPLFTYENNQVSKDEFVRAFKKNINHVEDKDKSLRSYLQLYLTFKLKVKAATDLKLDTLDQLKYDMMNFRKQLESDYPIDVAEALTKTNFKRNPAIKDEQLFRFADSVTLIPESRNYSIAKKEIFSLAKSPVKVGEWLEFVKAYKLNRELYKGESYGELLDKFISKTVAEYYRKHLEDYNPDFKYQLQEFKEGNLLFEVMGKKVWNKSTSSLAVLQDFYEKNKDHFLWQESAEVILVNAKSYAYADYANENIKNGLYWKKIADESENMIQADSARYEIAQLPVKAGTELMQGQVTGVLKSDADNGAGFVKVLKLYPKNQQRSFDEAKTMVINEYQKQLEENWMAELVKKYPVKINNTVFQSLLK